MVPIKSRKVSQEETNQLLEEANKKILILTEENNLLRAQLQASVGRSEFIEDCIAEMATVVYGGV